MDFTWHQICSQSAFLYVFWNFFLHVFCVYLVPAYIYIPAYIFFFHFHFNFPHPLPFLIEGCALANFLIIILILIVDFTSCQSIFVTWLQ